jgi:sec-independent protein translocase protein TatC
MAIQTTTALRPVPWPAAGAAGRVLAAFSAMAAMAQEMSFLEHLDELRRRLIWSVIFIGAAFVGCWMFSGQLYDLASAPIRSHPAVTLSISRPQDIFSLHVRVTMVAAIFVSAPLVLTQAWLFISPGLYPHERRYAIPFVLFASLLFLCGGAFGYFVAFPTGVAYLLDWIVASHLTPIIDAGEYFNLFFTLIVALGIVFQIPAVIFVLSRMGLVTAGLLARKLKYAIFGAVVIASVITQTGDLANMLVIAGPMVVLYVVGIGVAWLFGRRRLEPPAIGD